MLNYKGKPVHITMVYIKSLNSYNLWSLWKSSSFLPGDSGVARAAPDTTFAAEGASPDGGFGGPSLPVSEVE